MRVLITGSSGLLGANTAVTMSARHEVVGLYNHNPIHSPVFSTARCDLTDSGAIDAIMRSAEPELVIHCAALTDVDQCERQPALAERLNTDVAREVARAAGAVGARVIQVSTDMVFDGRSGGYSESDLPSPINTYGRTKLAGERAVTAEQPDSVIVRTNIFGWNAQRKLSLAEWILANYQAGNKTPGFTDAYFCPLLVNDLVDALEALAAIPLTGVVNVAGKDRISKFEFARRLAIASCLDPERVIASTLADAKFAAPRPSDLSLDTSFARSLGLRIPTADEGLARFLALRASGYAESLTLLTEED